MTQTTQPDLSSEQVIARYNDLIREEDELNKNYELREQGELRALEAAKREIETAIKDERENLVKGMPADMPFPESFDQFLVQKRDDQIRKRQEEYEAKKIERKKLHDAEKLGHAEKWKTALFTTQANPVSTPPNLDMAIPEPRPKKPIEIAVQTPVSNYPYGHIHPHRPVDVMRALGQQGQAPIPVPMMTSQPHQYAGIVVPQLLPRPPVVLSQSTTAGLPRMSGHPPHVHHTTPLPRPLEAQRVPFPPRPQSRMPEQTPIAKPRTALPETGRIQEVRPAQQGSFSLPRILPLGEQPQPQPRPDSEVGYQVSSGAVDGTDGLFKQFKRKAEGHPAPPQADKRAKVQETKPNVSASSELPCPQRGQKSISFDQVYQSGNPQFKHIIVEYPANSRKYYILKCEEHGVHFNQNPLAGAAKHLHSAQHGNMSKERAQAVELLGYNIFDCDDAKMRQNNAMVTDAFLKGYKPLNLNQLTKAERARFNLPGDASPTATTPKAAPATNTTPRGSTRETTQGFIHERPLGGFNTHQKLFTGITNPVAGELYLGYWANEKRNYAILILPFGDLKITGMEGTLEDTGLLDPSRIPKCYVYSHAAKTCGWAPGYEDGGPYVSRREFPVLYFDGRSSVGWLRAKDLSLFNFDDPLWREIPYFKEAVNYYAKIKGFSGFQEMREKTTERDGRFFGRNQHGLQHGTFVGTRPPAAPLPPTTLPSQSGLMDKSRVNADARRANSATVSPTNEVEMADASPVSDPDSYQDSINNKGLDSDNDAEMANTESRRTSVSNRGESQMEQSAPEQVLKQPFAQPIPPAMLPPPPVDVGRPYGEASTPGVYRMPPVGPPAVQMPPHPTAAADGPSQQSVSNPQASGSRSPNELAQIIASKALHLQSPERDQPVVNTPVQNGVRAEAVPRPDSGSNNGHGHRRVEKIHAKSSNPYRNSPNQSPSLSTSTLDNVSRNSSPASLHNILQNPSPQPQAVMARPGPLSQNGPASLEPHRARHSSLAPRPLPLEQNASRTTSPPQRSPSILASFSQPTRIPPSPPRPNGLGIKQPSRSPVMEHEERVKLANSPAASLPSNPPTRAPTPVILKTNSDLLGDRWRAVRAEQPAPAPISTSHLAPQSPREPALITPVTSVSETRSNSPAQIKEHHASPSPFVKTEAGAQTEPFDLACISINKEVVFDHSKTGGQLLRFTVDPLHKTVSTAPYAGVEVVVDPNMVTQAVVHTSNVSPASTVLLTMKDGKELELVFEVSEYSTGRIHARRFCRWMKSVNQGIDHKQTSFTSSNPPVITLD